MVSISTAAPAWPARSSFGPAVFLRVVLDFGRVNRAAATGMQARSTLAAMPRSYAYTVLDVFAERALEGNPLAVFHDAHGLSDAEMQAIARETNLSETTFILPGEAVDGAVRVRIFTTQEELPFAGHPTLGTASWLYLHHPTMRGAENITLRLNVGPIPVNFRAPQADEAGVFATMRQNDPTFGPEYDQAEVATILGLKPEDLSSDHKPGTASTGNPFCIVPLRSLEVAQRLAIPPRESSAWLAARGLRWFYCITPAATADQPEGPHWHNRMQFYSGEDPATGSAAGCCIAWLVRHGLAPSGQPVVFEQGIEMLRPSRITAQATLDATDGRVHSVLISGRTIPVATGNYFLS